MCENFRSVNEAILEWEGRDRSGVGVRISIVAVQRSRRDSISRSRFEANHDVALTVRLKMGRIIKRSD
jgi:hypothetical protein